LSEFKMGKYSLWNEEFYLSKVIVHLTDLLKPFSFEKQQKLTEKIAYKLKIDIKFLKDKNTYLTWDEILEMSQNNVDFGSHSFTHAQLSSLSGEKMHNELKKSKEAIEQHLEKKVFSIAYPFGSTKDVNEQGMKIASEIGYELGFVLGSSAIISEYSIGRMMLDHSSTSNMSNNFCKPVFAVTLSHVLN